MLKLPYAITVYFCGLGGFIQNTQLNRPDLVIENVTYRTMELEVLANNITNTSALSLTDGSRYVIPRRSDLSVVSVEV